MTDNEEYFQIEYPTQGATYSRDEYGVYHYSTYPESSVLAGQERRSFVDSFDTLEDAQKEYPNAIWNEEGTSFNPPHIPKDPPDWFDPTIAGESWDGE